MTLEEAKKDMERFVSLKTTMRPAFVDVLLQAEEVRHGHWISCDNDNDAPYECSVCGGVLPHENKKWLSFCEVVWCKKPYCAICGAKMDEVEDGKN